MFTTKQPQTIQTIDHLQNDVMQFGVICGVNDDVLYCHLRALCLMVIYTPASATG